MNNNNVRQISEDEIKKELTKEELQQTQVLNFQEVQRTIRFEKITSKKPAIIIAIIGVLSLLLGGTIQIATSLKTAPHDVQKRDTKKDIEVVVKNLICAKTTLNNPDNTNTVYNITYKFENEKLVGFTKEYNISAVLDKADGKKSIEKYTNEYNNLLNETDGYEIDVSTTESTISIKVVADYKKLDLTKLNEIQNTNPITKIDYNKYTDYNKIRTEMLESGFTVE